MERFFGTLKREYPMHFETRQQARGAIFESIEVFYNRVHRHSVLGYLSPVDFELSKR
jgi:transposase InsO family protein